MAESTLSALPVLDALNTAWNAHDIDRYLACFSPAYEGVDIGTSTPQRGLADLRSSVEQYLSAFPGLQIRQDETIIAGDRAVVVWTAQGTHRGAWMNIPATGRAVAVRGVSVLTLVEGQVTRCFHVWDMAGLLRGIGLLPDL